jgi:ribosomal protein L19
MVHPPRLKKIKFSRSNSRKEADLSFLLRQPQGKKVRADMSVDNPKKYDTLLSP